MPEHALTTVTKDDRRRISKERSSHPGPRGNTFLAFAGALGGGLVGFVAPASWGLWQIAAAAAGLVLGYMAGRLLLRLFWYTRGAREVLKERLLEEAEARKKAEFARDAGIPSGFQLKKDFEELLAEGRENIDALTTLVERAWHRFRRELPKSSSPMDWHQALPDDPTQRSRELSEFAAGLVRGTTYLISEQNLKRFNKERRRVEKFFNSLYTLRESAPEFYEETVVPRVKTQQYSVLHLFSYLQPALLERDFGPLQRPEVNAPWQKLWREWSADPPEHKHV